MRHFKAGLFLACLGLLAFGCQSPPLPVQPTNINIANTNTNQNGSGSSTDTGACPPVLRVDVSAPVQLLVNTSGDLDATPKTATGPRSDACNLAAGVGWTATPSAVCSITGPISSFTPNLSALAPGICTITAVVSGVSGSSTTSVK